MSDNVYGQDNVKGGRVSYHHGSYIIPSDLGGALYGEAMDNALSLLEVDVTVAVLESGSKRGAS